MPEAGPIEILDKICGINYLAIQEALEVIAGKGLDIAKSKVIVARDGASAMVIFSKSDSAAGDPKQLGVQLDSSSQMGAKDIETALSSLDDFDSVDRLNGANYSSIQVAEKEFATRGPNADLAEYKIDVVKEGDQRIIIFSDKDLIPGTRGAVAGRVGFEVTLKASDLSVVSTQFTR